MCILLLVKLKEIVPTDAPEDHEEYPAGTRPPCFAFQALETRSALESRCDRDLKEPAGKKSPTREIGHKYLFIPGDLSGSRSVLTRRSQERVRG